MRVSAGGTVGYNGGTSTTPRPTSSTTGAIYGAEVKRAKQIALGLFIALVIVHATKD